MKQLLLLSGPVAVGKSGVAKTLLEAQGYASLKSSAHLRKIMTARGLSESRTVLQEIGDGLDEQTDYRWVVDDIAVPAFAASPAVDRWLLDSVRKKRQVEHFRSAFGSAVLHVHFTASEATIQQRYSQRMTAGGELGNTDYAATIAHPNEISSRSLIDIADFVLHLDAMSSGDAAQAIQNKWAERDHDAPNRTN